MAKILGSFFSLESSGAIGKELIIENNKNKKSVKKFTTPKNPQTVIQQAHWDFMKESVEAWHEDGFTILDFEAWDRYAKTKKSKQTGFNAFNGLKINALKAGKEWTKIINCVVSGITGVGFTVNINIASDQNGVLLIGSSIKYINDQFNGVFSVDHYTFTVAGLDILKDYYFYIANKAINEEARTGIYKIKTTSIVVLGWFKTGWFNGWFN